MRAEQSSKEPRSKNSSNFIIRLAFDLQTISMKLRFEFSIASVSGVLNSQFNCRKFAN